MVKQTVKTVSTILFVAFGLALAWPTVARQGSRDDTDYGLTGDEQELMAFVIKAAKNADEINAYNLGGYVPARGSQSDSERYGVFHGYSTIEATKNLTRRQQDRLAQIVADPRGHRAGRMLGDPSPDYGLRIVGSTDVDVLIDFSGEVWRFTWVEDSGQRRVVSTRFGLLLPQVLELIEEVFPRPFALTPPIWRAGDLPETSAEQTTEVPNAFMLDDVQLEVLTQSKHGERRTWLVGSGEATTAITSTRGTETTQSTVDQDDIVRLIQRLYRVGYFDMKPEYSLLPTPSVVGDDVTVSAQRRYSILKVRVSCKIGSFEKCVSSTVGAPDELEKLAFEINRVVQPVAEKDRRTMEYKELAPQITSAIESVREITAYKLSPTHSANYRNSPEKLKRGVFLEYPILEPGVKLSRAQVIQLRAMIANPEAHRVYSTRGGLGPDFGLRIVGLDNTIDVLVDFAEKLWIFEWLDFQGVRHGTRFDAVQSDLYGLMSELYPEQEFGAADPKWSKNRRPRQRGKVMALEPPAEFRLKDVQMEVIVQTRYSTRSTWIGGNGKARSTERKATGAVKMMHGSVAPEGVIRLLQELYAMEFFDMNEGYSRAYTLEVHDGQAEARLAPLYSVGKVRVCCKIGAYEKCVVSIVGIPRPVVHFAMFASGAVAWEY